MCVTWPSTDEEWKAELKEVKENYEFSFAGASNGFRVILSSKLKGYHSLKKKYTVNNLGLVSHNKRFLYAAVGASGGTHDRHLFKSAPKYSEIIGISLIPVHKAALGNIGEIPLVTIGDTALPRFS